LIFIGEIVNINSIEYQLKNQSAPRTWGFTSSRGGYANIQIINGSSKELENIRRTLKVAFSNDLDDDFLSCRVSFSDNAGDTWIIAVGPRGRRILKNRQELALGDAESQLNSAVQDSNPLQVKKSPTISFATFGVDCIGSEICASKWSETWLEQMKMARFLLNRKMQLSDTWAQSHDIQFDRNKSMLGAFWEVIEPLYWSLRHCESQLIAMKSAESAAGPSVRIDTVLLKKQLQLISEVEEIYARVIEPGTSVAARRASRDEINQRIAGILAELDLEKLPSQDRVPDWTVAIELLTRMQILERLIQSTSQARAAAEVNISGVLGTFQDTVGRMITDQRQLVEELESCLATINIKLADQQMTDGLFGSIREAISPSTQREKVDLVTRWLSQLKFLRQKTNKSIEKLPQASLSEKIELMKATIEFALAKFYEMKLATNGCREIARSPIASLDDFYEQQIKGFSGLKSRWQQLCTEYSLPPEIKLKQLVKLASNHHRLFELSEKGKMIDDRIAERKSLLVKLENLVMQWRSINNSQKRTKLESSSMLVNEARSIIQYKVDRVKQLALQNNSNGETSANDAAIRQMTLHQNTLLKNWNGAFQSLGSIPLNPTGEETLKFLNAIRDILQLDGLIATTRGRPLEEMLSQEEESNITVWAWTSGPEDNGVRLQFLKSLENCARQSSNLFLIPDSSLAEIAAKIGIGVAREVFLARTAVATTSDVASIAISAISAKDRKPILAKNNSETPIAQKQQPAANANPPVAVMNPKARAVLDILNKRSNSPKRTP
jgi:hypothetical protein